MNKKGKTRNAKKGFIVWASVSGVLIALLLVVTILAQFVMVDLISSVLGRDPAVFKDGIDPIYEVEYSSKAEVYEAANELNEEVCEEGFVLLKNKQGTDGAALPLKGGEKVSVFGKNSVNIAYGGSGSSGGTHTNAKGIYDSLEAAGFETNPALKAFYENNSRSGNGRSENSSDLDSGDSVFYSTGETPQSRYDDTVKNSYADYKDVALVVFTRIGGEGFDLPRSMKGVDGARNEDDHYLQLDQNETDLLKAVCDYGFGKVIVLINSGSAMELAFLEDEDYYAYQDKIDAAIWMGFPGDSGTMALGRILNGEVNPSGRTVDTYAADFKQDPTWANFGDNLQYGDVSGDQYLDTGSDKYYYVDYEESIYVGYRYYETRGAGDEKWYEDAVVYPFGYGLSYTTFEWEIEDVSQIENYDLTYDDIGTQFTISIKVTNTGDRDGKEVVQLYGHAPYIDGEVEKSEVVLLDFAKTKEIKADGKDYDIVELTFDPYYLASYDYSDANGNGDSLYELDASEENNGYALYISHNAHDIEFTVPFNVPEDIVLYEDPVTQNTVENRYTGIGVLSSDYHLNSEQLLSRGDWVMPQAPTDQERKIGNYEGLLDALKDTSHNNPESDGYYELEKPVFGNASDDIVLRDLISFENGKPVMNEDGLYADYDDERWDRILNKLTVSELKDMVNLGAFKSNALPSISKPMTNDTDGPAGFTNFMSEDGTYWDTCYYCSEVVMGATWNTALIEELGKMVGNEGLVGADGRGNNLPYSGWYAPGVNIHRSPFGGRNFEYFSEDGVFTGKMAAAEIKGAQSRGVYCFVKHFALNDQETHRSSNGSCSWVTEQAMREIYLKPFEIAVKDGGTTAIMSSFNRIGAKWTGGDYRLITEILRNEWGFKGTVITDFNTTSYANLEQMAYAGGDLNLGNDMTLIPALEPDWCGEDDTADLYILRNCAKNILYTVANSNALNGEVDHYNMAWWKILVIVIDCVAAAGIAVWGFFAVRSFIKYKKQSGSSGNGGASGYNSIQIE